MAEAGRLCWIEDCGGAGCQRSLRQHVFGGTLKRADPLQFAVLEDLEIFLGKVVDGLAILAGDDNIQHHKTRIHCKRRGRLRGRLLRALSCEVRQRHREAQNQNRQRRQCAKPASFEEQ